MGVRLLGMHPDPYFQGILSKFLSFFIFKEGAANRALLVQVQGCGED